MGIAEVLQLFYRLPVHHSNFIFFFLERIWCCLIFFPKGSRYFQRGVCALSAYSSFQTGKCPSLPGWGGGQPSWLPPTQLEVSGFAPHSCRKGTPSASGVSPGGPWSPALPWGGGCRVARERRSPRVPQPGRGEETHPPAAPAKPA